MKPSRGITGMNRLGSWVLLPALLAIMACSEQPQEQAPPEVLPDYADLVLLNGGVYTVDEERSWAEAAAVRDGAFVAVGSNAEVESLVGPKTRVIDLAGRMALPGFHDAHVHPTMGGYALLGCDLEGLASVAAIIRRSRRNQLCV